MDNYKMRIEERTGKTAKAGKDVPFTAADLSSMNYSYKDGTITFSVNT